MQPKSRAGSFVRQAAILAAASLIVRFIGFLYRMPLTALIGDTGNAYYSAGFTIYTFVLIVSSGALPAAVSKLISERRALKQFRNAHEIFKLSMLVSVVMGTIGSLFMWFGAEWIAAFSNTPEAFYAIRTLTPAVFIVSFMAVFRGYFQGMRNNIPTALSQVAEQLFNAGFSVWLAYLFFDEANPRLEHAAAGGTAGTGIGALAGCLLIGGLYSLAAPRMKQRARRDKNRGGYESKSVQLKAILKTALPIIAGMSVFSIANFIDLNMIMGRLEAAGIPYGEAAVLYGQFTGKYVLLTTLPVSISMAMATAIIPNLAESNALNDTETVRKKINMGLRMSMIISIPAAVGLGVLSDPILKLLFPGYSEGGYLLRFGVAGIIFLALVQIITGILQGMGRVTAPVIGALCGMSVKIPLNYFLIADKNIHVIGAVISTCVFYLAAAFIDTYFLYRHNRVMPDFVGACAKPAVASVAMGLTCIVVHEFLMQLSGGKNTISTAISVLVGIAVYLFFMVLIKGFKKDDFERLPGGKKMRKLFGM